MQYPKIIILLSFSFLPLLSFAQNQPQIKIGTNGIPHEVKETGIAEVISVASFAKDGTLYVTQKNKAYTIESFELSVLPPTGDDILGPLAINASRGTGNISQLNNMPEIKKYLHDGTRIYIEKLLASCIDCDDMKHVTIKAFSIKLKE